LASRKLLPEKLEIGRLTGHESVGDGIHLDRAEVPFVLELRVIPQLMRDTLYVIRDQVSPG
jgi:hypothetical protein